MALPVKFFKSSVWEIKLNGYANLFVEHRENIHFELSIQIHAGVGTANESLADVQDDMRTVHQKLDLILFNQLRTPQEKELIALMNGHQPNEYLEDDDLLRELVAQSEKHEIARTKRKDPQLVETELVIQIRHELTIDTEVLLKDNFEVFHRKFEIRQAQASMTIRLLD